MKIEEIDVSIEDQLDQQCSKLAPHGLDVFQIKWMLKYSEIVIHSSLSWLGSEQKYFLKESRQEWC